MLGAAARTPKRFRRLRWAVAIVAAALLSFGANARAATVTVGSPLTQTFALAPFNGVITLANSALPEPEAHVFSPIDGTIVRWRVLGAEGGPFKLRVLRPAGGSTYTGAGTSSPETPTGLGLQTFATNLPIQAGDIIGVDNSAASDKLGSITQPGAQYLAWMPPLPDGSTAAAGQTNTGREAAFNADVEPISTVSTPPAAATPPPAAVARVRCVVPRLRNRKLRAAKRALRRRHCRIGKVTRKRRARAPRKAKVIKQRPKPGAIRPAGFKVNVTLLVRRKKSAR